MYNIKQKYRNYKTNCKESGCKHIARVKGYCMHHYTLNKKRNDKVKVNVLHDKINNDYEIHYNRSLIALGMDMKEIKQICEINNYEINDIKVIE